MRQDRRLGESLCAHDIAAVRHQGPAPIRGHAHSPFEPPYHQGTRCRAGQRRCLQGRIGNHTMKLLTRSCCSLLAVLVSSCGSSPTAPTGPSTIATPSPTPTPIPTPTPRSDGRVGMTFAGRYDHDAQRYIFTSGTFTITRQGPLDAGAIVSEASGIYAFALLRSNSPTDCSGVVVATSYFEGTVQSAHWDSVPPGTYCMNVPRLPRDRSYSWTGSLLLP